MEFDRTESAKFARAADELTGKLVEGVDKALSEAAGRGFPAPSGDTLAAILTATQDTKGKLVEANGKIYEEQRAVIFQETEFALKLLVRVAKLAYESYQAEIFNALALEQAQQAAAAERSIADVNRLNAETEKRQVAILRAKAEMEERVNAWQAQLVTTETATLSLERALIQAQLETAEKKLEIIDSIYKVLAAEELVLAAERRREVSLRLLLAAQQETAAIKEEMVPYYIQKANARQELAVATIQDAATREEIEKLGYDRLELKAEEEAAEHRIRQANEEFELAQEARTRADKITELARAQARRILQEYANEVRARILEKEKALRKDDITLKTETGLTRKQIGIDADVAVLTTDINNLSTELANILMNLQLRAASESGTIAASAVTKSTSQSQTWLARFIY